MRELHQLCARELRSRTDRQHGGEAAVVVAEAPQLPAQDDKAPHVVADRHRHRHEAGEVEVVGHKGDQLGELGFVAGNEYSA